jgi:hypothetical protein
LAGLIPLQIDRPDRQIFRVTNQYEEPAWMVPINVRQLLAAGISFKKFYIAAGSDD